MLDGTSRTTTHSSRSETGTQIQKRASARRNLTIILKNQGGDEHGVAVAWENQNSEKAK